MKRILVYLRDERGHRDYGVDCDRSTHSRCSDRTGHSVRQHLGRTDWHHLHAIDRTHSSGLISRSGGQLEMTRNRALGFFGWLKQQRGTSTLEFAVVPPSLLMRRRTRTPASSPV